MTLFFQANHTFTCTGVTCRKYKYHRTCNRSIMSWSFNMFI